MGCFAPTAEPPECQHVIPDKFCGQAQGPVPTSRCAYLQSVRVGVTASGYPKSLTYNNLSAIIYPG